jgi:hypothetical protein
MASTGKKCEISGIYQSDCTNKPQIALSKSETFPPYSHCRRAVNWSLIRATTHE